MQTQLEAWYRATKKAKWTSLEDVRQMYGHADGVPVEGGRVLTVFNLKGNRFRLIVGIDYERGWVFIKQVLTHAGYDKGDWKK